MKFDWLDYWLNGKENEEVSQNETDFEEVRPEHIGLKDDEISRIIVTLDDKSNVRILSQYNMGSISEANAESMALLLYAVNSGNLEAEFVSSSTRGTEYDDTEMLNYKNAVLENYKSVSPSLHSEKPVINPSEVFKTILTQGKA